MLMVRRDAIIREKITPVIALQIVKAMYILLIVAVDPIRQIVTKPSGHNVHGLFLPGRSPRLQSFLGSFHPLEVAFGAAARCARVRGGFHAVGVFDPGSTVSSPTSLSTQSPWHLRSSYNIADRSENAVSYRSVFGEFFTTTTETTCQPKTAQSRAGSTETRSESVSTTSPQHY
jgi:hypothetical protein